jgi:hypothetical protein
MERRRASLAAESYALVVTERGMAVRTSASLWLGAAIALAVLLGVAVPEVASAGECKCEYRFLDEVDEMRLRRAALKVLPKSVQLHEGGAMSESSLCACVCFDAKDDCPGWCFALAAVHMPTRFAGILQSIPNPLIVDGTSRDVDLNFHGEISLSHALRLADVSLNLYQNPKAKLASCGSRSAESDWESSRPQSQMPADKTSIRISVKKERTTETVWLHDVGIAIVFAIRPNEEAEPVASCCGNEIIVT